MNGRPIRGESAYYPGRRVRPNQRGMQVQHTRVDFLPPRWVCAICKVGWNVPHTFRGALHGVRKAA